MFLGSFNSFFFPLLAIHIEVNSVFGPLVVFYIYSEKAIIRCTPYLQK